MVALNTWQELCLLEMGLEMDEGRKPSAPIYDMHKGPTPRDELTWAGLVTVNGKALTKEGHAAYRYIGGDNPYFRLNELDLPTFCGRSTKSVS